MALLSLKYTSIKVGLLGGSFNPPHIGHIHITLEAAKRLNLSYVFWLITPCNPMKNPEIYIPIKERIKLCKSITLPHKNLIKVSGIEEKINSYHTADTLAFLQKLHPKTKFTFIIGFDTLFTLHKWKNYQYIIRNFSIAIFRRDKLGLNNISAKILLQSCLMDGMVIKSEGNSNANFTYWHMNWIDISSTAIRSMK